jgi:multiple sugar transport system substrate-binding protein
MAKDSRKQYFGRPALAVLVASALGAACTSSESSSLELWAAGREGEVVAQLIPEFEARNPGIRVHTQQLPWLGVHEKLLTAVVGESTPDIAQLGNTWVPEFATIHALEALDARVAGSTTVRPGEYFAGAWETNRFDGELYGVPWYVDTRLLFYRRDLLEEAGFRAPPRTWGEWLEMLHALHDRFQARGEPERSALFLRLDEPEPLIAFALQEGDPLLRDGGQRGNFQSPGFQRALSFYVSLFQSGLAPQMVINQVGNLWDEFARGNLVFYIGGPWQLGELARRMPPELKNSWATAPLPGREGPGASLALGSSLVVFGASRKKEAAWKLIEYLSEPDVQRRFYELTGDLPARRDGWRGDALQTDPRTGAFREQLERVAATPPVPEWERIQSNLAILAERAARGGMSVAEAARELDARTDRILEKRRWLIAQRAGVEPSGEGAPR